MAHKSFSEYLDHKNKLQNTGKVMKVADYIGPTSTKPAKEKKHKDSGGKGQVGETKPYAGGTNAKDPNKGKNGDGFAGKGDSKLKYTPGDDNLKTTGKAGVPGGKEVASWPKTKTQEWIDSWKDKSLAEFTKEIQKDTAKGLEECACQEAGHAFEAVKTAVTLARLNESVMAGLIREAKRQGCLNSLVRELLEHSETYSTFAKLMESEEKFARRLVRAMNEMVAPPMGDTGEEDEDPAKPPHPADIADEEDEEGDELGAEDDLDAEDLGGDDDMSGEDDMGMSDDPMADVPPHSKIMPTKKPHAHHHMIAAMKDNPMMAHDMKSALMRGI